MYFEHVCLKTLSTVPWVHDNTKEGNCFETNEGLVVQSIVSLTSSLRGQLRGQLVMYFMTLLLNTLIFFVEKN